MTCALFLLALGFGNLAMLGWLAAAAAPLLIHLWSRRRYREVPWAAVQYLLAAIRKNSRRIQLQQWLLLAVRTLILVLVVVAVAEPYGDMLGHRSASVPTHRVLVIDTSYSMAYEEGEVSWLSQAKRLASEIVEQSGPTDAFTLISLADPPRLLISRDLVDRTALDGGIAAIGQSDVGADLAATLDLVAAALELTADERQRFQRQEVYFFTDLQRETWQAADTGDAAFRDRLAELSKGATFIVVDVGAPHSANTAVTDLHATEAFIVVNSDATFSATLHEFSDQPRNGCIVEFMLDDRPVARQTVDIPAGGDAIVQFTQRFRSAGSHTVAVRAASDRLDIDNTRWLAVPVVERINVLCAGGATEDCRYIAEALNPGSSNDSPVRPRIISEGELAETDLEPFDCIFLSNVGQLTTEEADRLTRYIEQGGGLAIFLGDRVVASSYNAATAAAAGGATSPLLPARLGEVVTEPRFGIDPLDYRHSIVAPFRGRERAGLLSTPVSRYFRLELPVGRAPAEVAAATHNGDPLIVTAQLGRGRTVLVATAGSLGSIDAASGEPWTAWPAWPSFLPIVREILSYAMSGKHDTWQSLVGQSLAMSQPQNETGVSAEITRPDGQKVSTWPSDSAAGTLWSYPRTELSGIYSVRWSTGGEPTQFAVNLDTHESDLKTADPQKLPTELHVQYDGSAQTNIADESYVPRTPWHRSLLWTALALVFVELSMAWLFGRGFV